MRSTLIAASVSVLLLASGCSAGTKAKPISSDVLETKLSAELTKQAGQKPDDVSCPSDLPAKKGARVRCVLTAGADKLGITVTATSVADDGKVSFDAVVDKTAS